MSPFKELNMTNNQNNNYMPMSTSSTDNSRNSVANKLLSNLNELRLSSRLCDVEIIVGGNVILVSAIC